MGGREAEADEVLRLAADLHCQTSLIIENASRDQVLRMRVVIRLSAEGDGVDAG